MLPGHGRMRTSKYMLKVQGLRSPSIEKICKNIKEWRVSLNDLLGSYCTTPILYISDNDYNPTCLIHYSTGILTDIKEYLVYTASINL